MRHRTPAGVRAHTPSQARHEWRTRPSILRWVNPRPRTTNVETDSRRAASDEPGDSRSAGPDLIGRRVVGEINCPCGACEFCRHGLGKHCPQRTVLGIAGREVEKQQEALDKEKHQLDLKIKAAVREKKDDDKEHAEPVAEGKLKISFKMDEAKKLYLVWPAVFSMLVQGVYLLLTGL